MKDFTKNIFRIIGIAIAIFILWYFKSIVVYILISAIISLIGQPLVSLLCRIKIGKYLFPRSLSAGITLFLIWTLIFTFFRIFIPIIADQANELSTIDVQRVLQNIKEPLQKLEFFSGEGSILNDENFEIEQYLAEKIMSILSISHLSNFFTFFAGMLGDILVAVFSISFISFFFLKNSRLFPSAILTLIPSQYMEETTHIMGSISRLLKRYFIGVGIEIISVNILITIGLSIIGLDFDRVLIIGLFVALMNVIPYIGPLLGAIFGIVIGAATNLHLEFYTEMLPLVGKMCIVFISVQVIDNIVFQPLIYSNSVNAHPLEIFLVIMIAGNLAGITGMILAIPTYTIIRVIAKEFFDGIKVVNRLTQNLR